MVARTTATAKRKTLWESLRGAKKIRQDARWGSSAVTRIRKGHDKGDTSAVSEGSMEVLCKAFLTISKPSLLCL